MPGIRHFFVGISCMLLAGCASSLSSHRAESVNHEKLPVQQIADFLSTDCADIWTLRGEEAETNPLYWLRGMDCASRLSSRAARTEARQHASADWAERFRHGILMSNARITPPERRELLSQADGVSSHIPVQVRALYQLWRNGQIQQLQLAESRLRYSQLQQSSDAGLDAARRQQQMLEHQLEQTTRKLETLTDIERQLSNRKSAGSLLPGGAHDSDLPHAADSASKEK